MATAYLAPTANFVQKTLSGAISDAVTTITLSNTTNLQTPGYAIIDRENSAGTATPNSREFITYTGISGSDLTGVTRAADGSTARTHSDGALVEFVPTIGMWNSLTTIVRTGFTEDGYLRAINSPVSIAIGRFTQFDVPSIASIARGEIPFGRIPSALISVATILGHLNVSGASVSGFARTFVWYMPGFASAATTNVMRLITPFDGTFRAFSMITRTPVSAASLSVALYNIRSGASVFNTIGRPAILGGGTFVSTASINTPNFTAGDVLRSDIETGGSVADITLEGIAY